MKKTLMMLLMALVGFMALTTFFPLSIGVEPESICTDYEICMDAWAMGLEIDNFNSIYRVCVYLDANREKVTQINCPQERSCITISAEENPELSVHTRNEMKFNGFMGIRTIERNSYFISIPWGK